MNKSIPIMIKKTVSSGGKILLDIFLPSQNSTTDQIPHPPPKSKNTNPMPPNKCSGLVEYLFQNHTAFMACCQHEQAIHCKN